MWKNVAKFPFWEQKKWASLAYMLTRLDDLTYNKKYSDRFR
jgi:hypothetical protein